MHPTEVFFIELTFSMQTIEGTILDYSPKKDEHKQTYSVTSTMRGTVVNAFYRTENIRVLSVQPPTVLCMHAPARDDRKLNESDIKQ